MQIGYARVSTVDQNPEYQLRDLKQRGCDKIFTDHCTGVRASRPQLDAAMEYLRNGDSLIVWRFDRLGRSLTHLLEFAASLRERGINLISLTEAIDTTTPGGRLVFTVFAALAAFERELVRERTLAAIQAARERGQPWGRKSKLHDPVVVQAAKALLADEYIPKAKIARQLGISRTTLYRWFPGGRPEAFGQGRNGGPLSSEDQ
jgi:DNA invertase Pin-like site-specific DNA recombinase